MSCSELRRAPRYSRLVWVARATRRAAVGSHTYTATCTAFRPLPGQRWFVTSLLSAAHVFRSHDGSGATTNIYSRCGKPVAATDISVCMAHPAAWHVALIAYILRHDYCRNFPAAAPPMAALRLHTAETFASLIRSRNMLVRVGAPNLVPRCRCRI